MKKSVYILLFSTLFFNATIVELIDFVSFFLHKVNIDEVINNSKDEKITFIFSRAEFNTIKIDDSEIKFKGVVYDIISMSISNDSVTVIAYMDILEGKILEQLEEHSKSEQTKKLFEKITGFQFIVPSLSSLNSMSCFQSDKATNLFDYKFLVQQFTLQNRPKPPMFYKTFLS